MAIDALIRIVMRGASLITPMAKLDQKSCIRNSQRIDSFLRYSDRYYYLEKVTNCPYIAHPRESSRYKEGRTHVSPTNKSTNICSHHDDSLPIDMGQSASITPRSDLSQVTRVFTPSLRRRFVLHSNAGPSIQGRFDDHWQRNTLWQHH
jgi:hypothetical protein